MAAAAAGLELNLPDLPEVPIRLGQEPDPPPDQDSTARRPRANWRTALRDKLTAYLPLLLMVLLALGTWWLVKNSPQAPKEAAPRVVTGEPDYTLSGFGLRRFAADGSLQLTLEGQQLHHYPDSDRIEIEEVRLSTPGTNGPATLATARQARADGKATDVELLRGATIKARLADGQALEMNSDYLRVQVAQQRVSTHQPVDLRVGTQTVKAGGLVWENPARTLELKPPIRATLVGAPAQKALP
jgi:lipopolysaccharide export system protein LptC